MQQHSLFSGQPPQEPQPASKPDTGLNVYTVSQLTADIKMLLESGLPHLWVEGEITNFTQSGNGHFYFSLKDDRAIIRCVMWKSAHRFLKWRPKDGMKVMISGRLMVYEQRGDYQIEIRQIVPHGKGDLYAAFEQLKEKLQAEGLFDPKRKKPIPLLPKKLGIVTSPTGAVIRDMLNILGRRYINLQILIFPAKVQGEEAAPSIAEGIRVLNRYPDIDVLIVARGGGSLEDLWPFNEEMVARAVASSRIPVISAVGHETDTTICDFVADLRAPTPSAAAEQVIGTKGEFVERVLNLSRRVHTILQTRALQWKHQVRSLAEHRALAAVPQLIRQQAQTVDEYEARLRHGLARFHQIRSREFLKCAGKLNAGQLRHLIELKRSRLRDSFQTSEQRFHVRVTRNRTVLTGLEGKLNSLSPLAVLERGYSIASDQGGTILKDSSQTATGRTIQVRLHHGELSCEVKEIKHE
jgi:exodeoxyribonuclease VII large subunit